jgi:hypothetical protein
MMKDGRRYMSFRVLQLEAVVGLILFAACSPRVGIPARDEPVETDLPPSDLIGPTAPVASQLADVISVQVSGEAGAYQFAAEIRSPDTGCDQYADWWEVIGEDGDLIYRRVLLHSHAGEQPFVRSGGPVDISADEVVWVRAHMNPGGYGGMALRGSVTGGFEATELAPDFAAELVNTPTLPEDCDF